jgi:cytoskeletal protein CcmA (bactofilin family)
MTEPKKRNESSVVIDPARMNIVNKLAAGSQSSGSIDFAGGLLLQGVHRGEIVVRDGPLVLWPGSKLEGRTTVYGDAYVFGTLGEPGDQTTSITVMGTLFLTASAVVYGKMQYCKLSTYDGAQIHGALETITENHTERVPIGGDGGV